jgi:uncharacterized membrane protein (UPF0127 family)
VQRSALKSKPCFSRLAFFIANIFNRSYKSLIMTRIFIGLITTTLCLVATSLLAQTPLAIKPIMVGSHKVLAEIAATPSDRQQGLMFRTSMPSNQGMLFVFDEVATHCFWMRNTPLPLTIGFIDEAGVLINTVDMAPFNEASHCPTKPAKYALEMNQGWFVKAQIKAGTKVTGLPKP